jgi:hypothetical protein
MAIDFDKEIEEQEHEPTGPALERPTHFEDEEIEDDEEAFEEVDFGDLADDSDPVEGGED